jgi:hypothetical protein
VREISPAAPVAEFQLGLEVTLTKAKYPGAVVYDEDGTLTFVAPVTPVEIAESAVVLDLAKVPDVLTVLLLTA